MGLLAVPAFFFFISSTARFLVLTTQHPVSQLGFCLVSLNKSLASPTRSYFRVSGTKKVTVHSRYNNELGFFFINVWEKVVLTRSKIDARGKARIALITSEDQLVGRFNILVHTETQQLIFAKYFFFLSLSQNLVSRVFSNREWSKFSFCGQMFIQPKQQEDFWAWAKS